MLIKWRNNRLGILAGTVVVGLWLTLVATSCGDDSNAPPPRIVATVNDESITEDQLVQQLKYGPGPRLLVQMIDRQLIRTEARRRGIQPTPQQVELKLSTAISIVGSQNALEEQLGRRQMSLAEFKDRLRVDAMLDEIASQEITVSEAEINYYYQQQQDQFAYDEQVWGRMILLESRANAEAVAAALEAGGDFAGLAKALSIDPGTADREGDMGYFEAGDYAQEITEVAFRLEPGQVSDIFPVPDGYCILRVEGRRPASVKPLAEVCDQIMARLKQDRLSQTRRQWLIAQRTKADLKIPDQRLGAAVRHLLDSAPPANPYQF